MSVQPKRKRASLASLAEELNVSRTTVSNAYNRPDQLSEDLRNRILETAKKLGYPGPDPVARSLRTRKAGALGLLLTEQLAFAVQDAAAADFLSGLAESCGKRERGVLLLPASEISDPNRAAHVVHQASVDGFIIYSVAADDAYLKAVMSRQLPTVVVDQPRDVQNVPTVSIDDYGAMKEVADHVFGLGHKKVALLTIRQNAIRHDGLVTVEQARNAQMHVQRSRILGVLDSAAEHGIDPNDVMIVESFESKESAGRAASELVFQKCPECTALICTSDMLALGAMYFARSRGILVPEELTVTGFDGIEDALNRNLTTVRQPSEEKGYVAGELLFAAEKGVAESVVLDTVFQEGATAAPPHAGKF